MSDSATQTAQRIRSGAKRGALPGSEKHWRDWGRAFLPHIFTHEPAEHHISAWEWIERLKPGYKPKAKVIILARGGAKSSTAEAGTVRLGFKLSRRFCLYVSRTQEQADKHVQSISSLFERCGVGRSVNSYGTSKGWKRDQLRTENGFNVAALGLDVAGRGIRLDEFRPDIIVLDDIDKQHDSAATIKKIVELITSSILPSGSSDCAVLFIQNEIHSEGIAAQLVNGTADFLHDREPVIKKPAVEGLRVEREFQEDGTARYKIVAGTPTWEGQNLETCEKQINEWGYRAFRREAQHETRNTGDGLWDLERDIEPFRVTKAPELDLVVTGVDPNTTEGGDEAGIIVVGTAMQPGPDGTMKKHAYVLADGTTKGSPQKWATAAVATHNTNNGDEMVAEANQGGEMVKITIQTVENAPKKIRLIHASKGKVARAEPIQKDYEDGLVHHVGYLEKLEAELTEWVPGMPSPNRMDALVWALTVALHGTDRKKSQWGVF